MFIGVITIFPDMFQAVTKYGVTGRSIKDGFLSIKVWNPRDFSDSKYKNIDDRPYGGGPGMLMLIQPLKQAINTARCELGSNSRVIYLSPQGKRLNQKIVNKLAFNNQTLILVCGRYQGIDERLIETEIDEEWSIGDYILSGGELAAMICIDTISRMLPNTLHNQDSTKSDSFYNNRLACPQYTRPKIFEGTMVPSILLSGNHYKIQRWRVKQALGKTWIKRPDLFIESPLSDIEEKLLTEFKNEYLLKLKKDLMK